MLSLIKPSRMKIPDHSAESPRFKYREIPPGSSRSRPPQTRSRDQAGRRRSITTSPPWGLALLLSAMLSVASSASGNHPQEIIVSGAGHEPANGTYLLQDEDTRPTQWDKVRDDTLARWNEHVAGRPWYMNKDGYAIYFRPTGFNQTWWALSNPNGYVIYRALTGANSTVPPATGWDPNPNWPSHEQREYGAVPPAPTLELVYLDDHERALRQHLATNTEYQLPRNLYRGWICDGVVDEFNRKLNVNDEKVDEAAPEVIREKKRCHVM